MKIKQCPSCKNNIRIHQIKFPTINDYGGIIVECQKCCNLSYMRTINPDELSISLGGLKYDTWDDNFITEENIIKKYPSIKELKQGVEVIGDIEAREYSFNYELGHIYYCNHCNNEVENIARNQLKKDFHIISDKFKVLINFVAANDGWNRENLVIEVKCKCNCGQHFISFWHYKYLINFLALDFDKTYLIGTDMPLNAKNINGIMSKNNCIITLEKLIIR